jgi:large conductance mechanosensitive channel
MPEKKYCQSHEKAFLKSGDLEDYRRFAFRDDMLKLSVGFMLGGAFNGVVRAISECLVMPIVNFLISSTDGGWRNLAWQPMSGLRFEVGSLLGSFVDFFLISAILYILYMKIVGRITKRNPLSENPKKICPECTSLINAGARRCPMCTGVLNV